MAGFFMGLSTVTLLSAMACCVIATSAEVLPGRLSTGLVLNCSICHCVNRKADCSEMELEGFEFVAPDSLVSISLKGNILSSITNASFQKNLQLEIIDLSDNKLTVLPDGVFGGLSRLRYLDLTFNQLVYSTLPVGLFHDLGQLLVLKISDQHEQQTPFPVGMVQPLSSLQELHMTGTPSVDSSFMNLTSLRLLNFGDSWCSMPNVSEPYYWPIVHLSNLSVISFRNCKMHFMSKRFMASFPILKRADFSCNYHLYASMAGIVSSLAPSLEVLLVDKVSGNQHDDTYKRVDFNSLVPLHKNFLALSVRYNMFSSIKPVRLNRWTPHLKYLYLSNDQQELLKLLNITSIDNILDLAAINSFADVARLVDLRFLDATGITATGTNYNDLQCESTNSLIAEESYPWDKYPKVPTCDKQCLDEFITDIISGTLTSDEAWAKYSNLTSLRNLRIRHSSYGGSIIDCTRPTVAYIPLEELDMAYARSEHHNILVTCLLHAPRLRKLHLQHCSLESINLEALYGLHNLSYLDLSFNKLGKVVSRDTQGLFFSKSLRLSYLDLSFNKIFHIPTKFFQALISLKSLILSGNSLVNIDISLSNCISLENIDLSEDDLLPYLSRKFTDNLPNNQTQVKLANDHFVCDCRSDSTYFVKWAIHDSLHLQHADKYTCNNKNNLSFKDWTDSSDYRICIDGPGFPLEEIIILAVGAPVTLVILIALIIVSIYHRYWIYKHGYLLIRRRPNNQEDLEEQENAGQENFSEGQETGDRESLLERPEIGDRDNLVGRRRKYIMKVYMAVEAMPEIANYLREQGIKVTSYFSKILPGHRINRAIDNIVDADVVIVCLSESFKRDRKPASFDYFYAHDEPANKILTVTSGDVTEIRRDRTVRNLLTNTAWMEYDEGDMTFNGRLLRQLLDMCPEADLAGIQTDNRM